eukprot:scaffold90853_cov18-Phaeocystis_antarctica.AAC.1
MYPPYTHRVPTVYPPRAHHVSTMHLSCESVVMQLTPTLIPTLTPNQVCESLVMQLKQQVIIQRRLQQRVTDRDRTLTLTPTQLHTFPLTTNPDPNPDPDPNPNPNPHQVTDRDWVVEPEDLEGPPAAYVRKETLVPK